MIKEMKNCNRQSMSSKLNFNKYDTQLRLFLFVLNFDRMCTQILKITSQFITHVRTWMSVFFL